MSVPVQPSGGHREAAVEATDARVLEAAADWLVRLNADDVTAEDEAALRRWLAADARHLRAWQRAQGLLGSLRVLPAEAVKGVLDRPPERASSRRRVLRLAWLPALPAAAWLAREELPWAPWQATHRTQTGEQQQLSLADGSRLVINTATALKVRDSADQPVIELLKGEVFIATAPSATPRSLRVQTAEGAVQAQAAQFSVRRLDDAGWGHSGARSRLTVFSGEVDLSVGRSTNRLLARQQLVFSASGASAITSVDEEIEGAWLRGIVIARGMPLGDLVAELDRYRPGVLRCSPQLAQLRVSGVFPVNDPDRSLDLIARSFPVELHYRTRYWVTLQPRQGAA